MRSHDHDVLEPHAEPSRQVDAGLHRKGVPLDQYRVVPGHQVRVLVLLDADAVPGAVDEVLPQPGVGDDPTRHRVDVRSGGPGPHRPHRRLLGLEQHGVTAQDLGVGLADHDRAGDVGAVAHLVVQGVLAAEVAHHGVSHADDTFARVVVWAGTVGSAPHDGEVHPAMAGGQ